MNNNKVIKKVTVVGAGFGRFHHSLYIDAQRTYI